MIWSEHPKIEIFNADCMDSISYAIPNKYSLAIADPPYGAGDKYNFRFNKVYENKVPDKNYFDNLLIVSKNQIIWGGNYFTDKLPVNRCWISWYKGQPIDLFSDFELAWTSFDDRSKAVKLESYGFNHADRRHNGQSTIHPTQKPVALYKWLLKNYAKEGDKILDTHLGSGSIAIACYDMGFSLTGFEIDKDYYNAAFKRFKQHIAQLKLF